MGTTPPPGDLVSPLLGPAQTPGERAARDEAERQLAAVTADSITDEQIRELQEEAIKVVNLSSSPLHLLFAPRERPGVELLYASTHALGETRRVSWYDIEAPAGQEDAYRAEGRRYCAELISIRRGVSP